MRNPLPRRSRDKPTIQKGISQTLNVFWLILFMELTKREKEICNAYSKHNSEGYVACHICPLCIDKRYSECYANVEEEDYDLDSFERFSYGTDYERIYEYVEWLNDTEGHGAYSNGTRISIITESKVKGIMFSKGGIKVKAYDGTGIDAFLQVSEQGLTFNGRLPMFYHKNHKLKSQQKRKGGNENDFPRQRNSRKDKERIPGRKQGGAFENE